MFSETPDMRVTAEATNGQAALEIASRESFEVVLLDLGMPGRGGLDILKDLTSRRPPMRVLVLSIYAEEQYALPCLQEGAYGYLSKASSLADVVRAARVIAGGERYITHSLAQKMAMLLPENRAQPGHHRLSTRELQILTLLGAGKTITQISRELSLSPKTIATYRARILPKLGLETTAELIRYALQNGLV